MCLIIHGIDSAGRPFTAFQCGGDPDERMALYAMADNELARLEMERDAVGLGDPNRCDSRRVRRELGDRMVNLGRRVNAVPARSKHW